MNTTSYSSGSTIWKTCWQIQHKILGVIKDELMEIKEKYGDARRTQIVDRTKGTLTSTDLLPDQAVWVSVDDAWRAAAA